MCGLLRKAVSGVGNYPKKKQRTTFKVATLQRYDTLAILQGSFSGGGPYERLAECAESAFSKAVLCPSENAKPARRLHF